MYFIASIPWPESQKTKRGKTRRRGRPYVYSPTVILRCLVVRLWFRLDSNNGLHQFLIMDYPYNHRIVNMCGLPQIPDRRTFDRRLKTISLDVKERITFMSYLFVREKIIDPYIVGIDSTLLKAKGHIWHKSSMIKGIIPHSGIDTDARWGFSHTGMDIWLQITSDIKYWFIVVPLSAEVTTANIYDNQMYESITSCLPRGVKYASGDSGYDDQKLYKLSIDRGFELVCPVSEIYSHTSSDRLQLIEFYESKLGQAVYSWRSISIEPLIEHIKEVFKIDPLPLRGYQKVAAIVLLSVLVYQIMIYYNCKTGNKQPKAIKHMLGS